MADDDDIEWIREEEDESKTLDISWCPFEIRIPLRISLFPV